MNRLDIISCCLLVHYGVEVDLFVTLYGPG
jgi:hypothetical protein